MPKKKTVKTELVTTNETPQLPVPSLNIKALVQSVVNKEDFCFLPTRSGTKAIEPKRDLALKLFAVAKLSYDTEIPVVPSKDGDATVYLVKAKVYKGTDKVAEGLGAASTDEIQASNVHRRHHDALARAETRAFKRALEACVGLPFINQIIMELFGTYEIEPENKKYVGEKGKKELEKEYETKKPTLKENAQKLFDALVKALDDDMDRVKTVLYSLTGRDSFFHLDEDEAKEALTKFKEMPMNEEEED